MPAASSDVDVRTGSAEDGRLRLVLDGLIAENARRIEWALIVARVLVLFASLSDLVIDIKTGAESSPVSWYRCAVMVVALVGLGLIALFLRRSKNIVWLLRASVIFDAAVIFVAYSVQVIYPKADYPGLLRMMEMAILPLAIVAAGCRLHKHLAILGIVSGAFAWTGLIVMDVVLNGEVIQLGAAEITGSSVVLVAASILALVVAFGAQRMVYQAARMAIRGLRAQKRLRVYVSDEVADRAMAESDETLSLDGEQRHVAVLFCDLRSFTEYANRVKPKQLVAELNNYFDALVPSVTEHGGRIDKFMGDAIMAVFSVERDQEPPAARALAAGLAMHDRLAEHNRSRAGAGLPELRHGIGIHSGWVVAGNVGTEDRLQYTVIGDVVNIAARLEKETKERGHWLLCTETVWFETRRSDPALAAQLAPLDTIELRGVASAVRVFAPKG